MNRAHLRAAVRTLAVAGLLSGSAFTAHAGPISLDPRIAAAVPNVTQVQYQPQYGAPVYQYPPQYPQQPQYQPAYAPPPPPQPRMQQAAAQRGEMGGGFIEFLFGGGQGAPQPQRQFAPEAPPPEPPAAYEQREQPEAVEEQQPGRMALAPMPQVQPQRAVVARPAINPKFLPQVVDYTGAEKPGTIIIDTRVKYLFLVQNDGTAMRYGVGVGKPGFLWAGTKTITRKREWPDWTPPPEMLQRRPDLPRHMEGGPENPLGARAMYLGSTLYRIHGSNEPWTIGTNVSSGCIRMRNQDVIDLYNRVKVGTKVVVI